MLYYMDAIGTLRILHFPDSSCGITCGILLSIDIRTQRHNWSNPFDITDIMRVQKKKNKRKNSAFSQCTCFFEQQQQEEEEATTTTPCHGGSSLHSDLDTTRLQAIRASHHTQRRGEAAATAAPPASNHGTRSQMGCNSGRKPSKTIENHRKPSKTIEVNGICVMYLMILMEYYDMEIMITLFIRMINGY